jgi:hypothetical protein
MTVSLTYVESIVDSEQRQNDRSEAMMGLEAVREEAGDQTVQRLLSPQTDHVLGRDLRRQMGVLLPSELASMLDCKETTLMSWRMAGSGPDFVKISKMVYYRIADVQDWMAANVKVTTRTMAEA